MAILLQDDYSYKLPPMTLVGQHFPRPTLADISGTIAQQIGQPSIRAAIKPGAKVAVAVGSRGIRNLAQIVKDVLDQIKSLGGQPFIVTAMGSHGGGTSEGQLAVLASYGITEESMGAPINSSLEVAHLGRTSRGVEVYFDQAALAADLVVPINRIKLHTDFVAPIQSGLCKMLVIGLGNHVGCSAIHEEEFDHFGETILEAAKMIMAKAKIWFGLGIVENAYDETAIIEAISPDRLIEREMELVKMARANMPTLMIPEIDVLVVSEIGKNISGAGYDPNILGRSFILKEFVLKVPAIGRMVLLGLSRETHGNAIGLGAFDVICRNVYQELDFESIYANALAVKCPEDARIPMIADDEEQAIRMAVKTIRGLDRANLKIVKIKNTMELETIQISEALLAQAAGNPDLSIIGPVV